MNKSYESTEQTPTMTRSELTAHMRGTFDECLKISSAKSEDYCGPSDPFKNFRLVEHLNLCDPATGIMVRITDKVSRVANLLHNEAHVRDESVVDTLRDLINYAALLAAYLESTPRPGRRQTDQESAEGESP